MEDKTLIAMGVATLLVACTAGAKIMGDSTSKDEGVLSSVGWSL
eukprot:CAMPEP_0173432044 /NCGR_PEP_ID=MMETSP1357-20121228/9981_1 /TAXON_ID=77926 /ORGANISM="Hemiselmis rufescens, Strain PCC563" /LENGTH=43 /DNA_ID= /DNA_START= /DNA_END= /DNA_ORIENTATION=